MYRLVRRFRARVRTREIIALSLSLIAAAVFGGLAGSWYHNAGYLYLAASAHASDDKNLTAQSTAAGESGAANARHNFDTQTEQEENDIFRGFFSAPGKGVLFPAGKYTASYLLSLGEAQALPPDGSAEGVYSGADDQQAAGGGAPAGEDHFTYAADGGAEAEAEEEPTYTVKVIYKGERHVFETTGKKVEDLFAEKGIVVTEKDKVSGAYLDGTINSDLYIEIKRENSSPAKAKAPAPAAKKAPARAAAQNASGTKTGRDGIKFHYSRVVDVKCTAYTSSFEDTGKRPGDPGFGITKTGMVAKEGIVAVDPNVIPLGTKIYIEILDNKIEDYGYAVAGDTGGKIKGKKVDLYFNASADEIKRFGVRKAKVYILD